MKPFKYESLPLGF